MFQGPVPGPQTPVVPAPAPAAPGLGSSTGSAIGSVVGRALGALGALAWPSTLGDGTLPDAANDSKYDDGDKCPPDCKEWLKSLNKAYHALEKLEGIKPGKQVLQWQWFWDQVKKYEAKCGPYTPPPSFDDIYQR